MQIGSFARSHSAIPLLPFVSWFFRRNEFADLNFHEIFITGSESRGDLLPGWVQLKCNVGLRNQFKQIACRNGKSLSEEVGKSLKAFLELERARVPPFQSRLRRSFLTSSLADPLSCAVIDVPRYFLRTTSTGRHVGDFFVFNNELKCACDRTIAGPMKPKPLKLEMCSRF